MAPGFVNNPGIERHAGEPWSVPPGLFVADSICPNESSWKRLARCFHAITALASANNSAQGFFWPTTPSAFDRPFKSWRLKFTAASQITNCVLALCANGVQ